MTTSTYSVPNISCGHCTRTIESEVSELPGVASVKASPDTREVTVTYDAPATEEQIVGLLREINYPPAM